MTHKKEVKIVVEYVFTLITFLNKPDFLEVAEVKKHFYLLHSIKL